ncbi:hypothetical protein Q8A67_004988 [Cirrhinus molitorella]|uniref:Uncharacterized protein n=1 Tax=Cirrhinus molitorella TaxID=172907 RepID=A0AA88TU82_9TELE|nr:hypothetical protein Q8A67_004988 [Cirrhinus molitorella]
MYAAKPFLCWIIILYCWQETQAKPAISMLNRTRVALAGESLNFSLSVVIPANYTTSELACYRNKTRIWHKVLKSEFLETKKIVVANIEMHNSSSSGNYYFSYAKNKVHWVVHVRDNGYEEPPNELDNAVITMMACSGIFLIFSVAGSFYILKSYKEHPPGRDDKNKDVEQRPEESDEGILDEDAASPSLYTSLQYRSSSVYDTLHPDTMHENTKKKKTDTKVCLINGVILHYMYSL